MDNTGEFKDGKYLFPVRVYYSDTDAGGIVYHARYLDMAEHARCELFRKVAGNQKDLKDSKSLMFVVRSIKIDYLTPGYLDDLFIIETSITKKEVFSLTFQQNIMRDDVLVASLEVKAASISAETVRPIPMDKDWGITLMKLIGT
jgi:acyl-CoA thioester hydrolase